MRRPKLRIRLPDDWSGLRWTCVVGIGWCLSMAAVEFAFEAWLMGVGLLLLAVSFVSQLKSERALHRREKIFDTLVMPPETPVRVMSDGKLGKYLGPAAVVEVFEPGRPKDEHTVGIVPPWELERMDK